ncbi:hypothetical protein PC117_g4549 [Phytophthora cactorum]|uniref:Uncharacterized protein n=1 Tax=Phytophthora cactorum TaxID=29920 RepID=A0A8T1E9Q7_9STRA|nr:hypothetical protein PC117_g4549 [Phytophthora cactorum]
MERQQKLAEALETLVQARIKQQMAEFSALSNPKLGRCFTGRALDFRADINDFKGLLAELEKARREVGAVFAANRLNTTESSHHGVQLRSKKGANGMHLEVFANKAMPFNVRDTAEATWDHFKGMKKHGGNGNLYDKAAKSLDTPYTIIEDYAKELFANTARADVRVKQITIAESQRRRREGSELENVRLKLIVDRQRKVADNLQTLLQKRASQLVSTKKHASNDSIYEKAARNLDEPYTIIEEFTKELYSNSSRADIKRQQKVADDLKSLLQRKARQLSNECMSLIAVDSPRHHNIVNVLDVRGNLGDFQQLFRHLEAARQEVDVVFAANGLADMVATPSNIHIREGDDGKYLEAFSNKLLAFRLHAVTEALWSHFKSLEKHAGNGSLYQKAEKYIDESNTILEDFTMEMHSNTARADIKVKQIIRRYVETDQRQQKVADSLSSLLKRRASQLMNDCASVVDGVEKHLGNGCIYEKAAKDLGEPYTVIEAFTKEMHSNNARADVKVKQVVRRYVEADHDLVIWVARVSPAEIRHKMLRGLTYILRGYAKL